MMLTALILAAALTVQAQTPAPAPVPPAQPAAGPATDRDWRTAGAERFGTIEFADPDKPAAAAEEPDPDVDEAANAFAWFGEAYGQGAVAAEGQPADCVTGEPAEGERACTFDEALANSYRTQPAQEVYQEPPQPRRQSGCRREEYTNADGSGGGVRVVCGSGDSRAIDALRQSLQPFPR